MMRRWQQAQGNFARKQFVAAIQGWEGVLAEQPDHVPTLLWLARAYVHAGHYRRGRDYALQACALRPQDPKLAFELLQRLCAFHESTAAIDYVRSLDFELWTDVQHLLTVATLLVAIGAHAQAESIAELALKRNSENASSLYIRASLAMFAGHIDVAERSLEHCLSLAPQLAGAHWLLSQLQKHTAEHNHVERLRHRLALADLDSGDAAYLNFALHFELHDLGRHEEAWATLQRGCKITRARTSYDAASTAHLFQRIKQVCDADFCSNGPAVGRDPTPVFIVGMHRSGTTLLEQILGGHTQIADAGETYGFPAQMRLATDHGGRGPIDSVIVERATSVDFSAVGKGYLADAAWRAQGRAVFTDKLPSNFLNLGFIARALPQAKFLHMTRAPRDVCFSNLRAFFSGVNGYSYDQVELAGYYTEYRALMEHWHDVLPGRVLDVSYDLLVRDPERVTREVMDFLDLPFEPAQLAIERRIGLVSTASTVQVRQGIRAPDAPAWKPYEAHLQPLFSELARLQAS